MIAGTVFIVGLMGIKMGFTVLFYFQFISVFEGQYLVLALAQIPLIYLTFFLCGLYCVIFKISIT